MDDDDYYHDTLKELQLSAQIGEALLQQNIIVRDERDKLVLELEDAVGIRKSHERLLDTLRTRFIKVCKENTVLDAQLRGAQEELRNLQSVAKPVSLFSIYQLQLLRQCTGFCSDPSNEWDPEVGAAL